MKRPATLLVLAAFLLGCGRGGRDAAWVTVDPGDLSPPEADRYQRARGAAMLLGQRLLGRLTDALSAGGPAGAIAVCREAASKPAREVQEETGMRIGRTSSRLRNPENRPPAWMGDPGAAAQPRVYRGPGGRLGVTIPIRVKGMCLPCHGPADRIDPSVRAKLAELYPADRAVGYAEGDLRGAFWIEVPGEK